MSQDWDIKACGHVCASTNEPFVDGQVIYSCLYFNADGYVRADFSEAGWSEEARRNAVSYWKSVYRAPPPPAAEPMKKETAEALLRQFIAKDDYSNKNVIFILAVMLERKRILVERDVQDRGDGTRTRIYEHKKTGEMFTIPDPGLKLAEIETVQNEVMELLGLSTKPEPAPAPTQTADTTVNES